MNFGGEDASDSEGSEEDGDVEMESVEKGKKAGIEKEGKGPQVVTEKMLKGWQKAMIKVSKSKG